MNYTIDISTTPAAIAKHHNFTDLIYLLDYFKLGDIPLHFLHETGKDFFNFPFEFNGKVYDFDLPAARRNFDILKNEGWYSDDYPFYSGYLPHHILSFLICVSVPTERFDEYNVIEKFFTEIA